MTHDHIILFTTFCVRMGGVLGQYNVYIKVHEWILLCF